MPNPKIFIASSTLGKKMAQSFAKYLSKELGKDRIDIVPWYGPQREPGTNTYDDLRKKCRDCDFAAVFLTKDDTVKKGDGSSAIAARDNCIFEAGLFIGAFAAQNFYEPRCFLLTSLTEKELPTDFAGVQFLPFDEGKAPPKFNADLAKRVAQSIQKYGALVRPELPCLAEAEIMNRERLGTPEGDLVAGSQVVISLTQPGEVNSSVAKRVLENFVAGIKYRYFLSVDEDLGLIAQLVQSLAAVDAGEGDNPPMRCEAMKENPDRVRKNLRRLKESMTVYFLTSRKPLEVVIHNAISLQRAKCYLRRPEEGRFVLWCERDKATQVVKHLEQCISAVAKTDKLGVFRSTSGFNLGEARNRDRIAELRREIEELFPAEFHSEVMAVCFGPLGFSASARGGKR
jgi:hypothetical protein